MTIKTLYFDYGGVIYRTPSLAGLKRWKNILGLADDPEIMAMLENPNDSQFVNDICLGKVPEDKVWTMLAEKWHIKSSLIRRLRRVMDSKRRLNKPILNLIGELKENYRTAILSNAGDQTRQTMEEVFHLDQIVDEIIISAEEGVIKPDHQIYQIAMDRMDASPETSLFIDDYLVNVQAARDFGMKAVHFVENTQAIQAIRGYLAGAV